MFPVFNMAKSPQCYITAAIFLSCHVIHQVDPQQCKSEYSIYGMMLKGHVFEEKKTATILSCVLQCDANIRCQSLNYVISQYVCELNSRTKDARPQDFIPDADRIYITRLGRVPLGSIPELPAESCAEIKASEGEYAVNGNYWLHSIKPGQAALAPCNMMFIAECLNYQTLSSGDRKVTHGGSPLLCDNTLGPGWFRFQGNAGKKMPTSRVPKSKCGTDATGWLNGSHPTVEEGKVTRQVCFHWYSNYCQWFINIHVLNCTSYYLYFINGTPPEHPCHLRYCGTD